MLLFLLIHDPVPKSILLQTNIFQLQGHKCNLYANSALNPYYWGRGQRGILNIIQILLYVRSDVQRKKKIFEFQT